MPLSPSIFTWAAARDELQLRMGRSAATADSGFTNRLSKWLDTAQQRIAAALFEAPELEETVEGIVLVADQSEYNYTQFVPALNNLHAIKAIRNTTSGHRMIRFPFHDFLSLTTQSQGAPFRWARKGHVLAFDPQPDDAYEITVHYRKYPEPGVMNFDSGDLQDDTIRLAASIGWSSLDQHERAKQLLGELSAGLQVALANPPSQEDLEAYYDPDLRFHPFPYDYARGGW